MGADKPKILLVDDELDNIEYLRRALRDNYEVLAADSGVKALALLHQHKFAVIVSDQRMPGMSGVEFLTQALKVSPETIRIVLTGYADLEATIDAINLSHVSSFMRKPVQANEIEHAVVEAVELYSLRLKNQALTRELETRARQLEDKERLLTLSLDDKTKELLRAKERLEELVVRDGLTGLYNHRYFQERTEQEVQRAARYGLSLSLVFFDLDHFKIYNDLNGHPQGDEALVQVAQILSTGSRVADVVARVRGTDIVARYGGEEFVVLLPETTKAGALIMAQRLCKAIERQEFPGEDKLPHGKLTVSAGVADMPTDAKSRSELIRCADAALYQAKAAGRNRVHVYGTVAP